MASPFDAKYNNIREKITIYANRYGIPVNIGIWQIWQESRFNPNVCSGKNACGIAQFIPATAQRFGVNRNDIDSSLDGWGRYMAWLLRQPYINGKIELALAGYNAGEGSVKKYKGIPPFTETRNYVKTIMANAGASYNANVNLPSNYTDSIITSTGNPNTDLLPFEDTSLFENTSSFLAVAFLAIGGLIVTDYLINE